MIKLCFLHSWGWLQGNSAAIIPELTTSWCSILRNVRTITFNNHGGFLLLAAIHWSCSAPRTPTVHYMINWQPFTMIWIHSHPCVCGFLFLLLPDLRTMFECASWVICLVAILAQSLWTYWCLHSCCVPTIAVLDVAPANRLDFDPLPPGWGNCISMSCWCGIGEEDDN